MNPILIVKKIITEMEKLGIIKGQEVPPLLTAVERARREWQQSLRELDNIDADLADSVIFKINSCESRYEALLKEAKRNSLTAWTPEAGFTLDNNSHSCPAEDTKSTSTCTG